MSDERPITCEKCKAPVVWCACDQPLNTPEVNRWIPVGERLPDQRIVLWFDRDSGEMATGGLDRVRDDKPIVLVFRSRDGLHYISTFTHWRPLPTPPEQEA